MALSIRLKFIWRWILNFVALKRFLPLPFQNFSDSSIKLFDSDDIQYFIFPIWVPFKKIADL